jgi:CelD/BcsL family acetyltransferase involved in cellulose biosynthesis
MIAVQGSVRARILAGFDDPGFGRAEWDSLLRAGETDVLFLTWAWQRALWAVRRRDTPLLVLAERDGSPVALAPFYDHDGYITFNGAGYADYQDFVGDVSEAEVLDALLEAARAAVPRFRAFMLDLVPDTSRTGRLLRDAAGRLGLSFEEDDVILAPAIDLRTDAGRATADRKSSVAHERRLRRDGALDACHFTGEDILLHLEPFFEQHVARWRGTLTPSRFEDESTRAEAEETTRTLAPTGWLRFTRIDWEGRPIAFHYGSCYRGRYFLGTPTYDVRLAQRSPGQVLVRQLLLAAIAEGAHTFDFGIGDEEYKLRLATHSVPVRSYELNGKRD